MHLYHLPGTRSTRALWMLEEIGAPFELTVMAREDRQTPEHLARHPLGRVPAAELDDGFVFESAGICLHLADLHPEAGLAPPPGSHERALLYQWLFFTMTELEPALVEVLYHQESDPPRAQAGADRFRTVAAVVEKALEGREWLVGSSFSVADVVCGAVLGFGKRLELIDGLPNIEAYVERVQARPAYQRANEAVPA